MNTQKEKVLIKLNELIDDINILIVNTRDMHKVKVLNDILLNLLLARDNIKNV